MSYLCTLFVGVYVDARAREKEKGNKLIKIQRI